jgi:S1-C subfamily serine protease
MKIHLKLFLGISFFLSQVSFGQTFKTLGMDGKLKKTDDVLSDVITIIPKGEEVEIVSGPVKGVYFVHYNDIKGYLNELYFMTPKIHSSSSTPSSSSSYSSPQKWNEYNLKEHWKTKGMEKIEGIYESTGSYTDIEIPCKNGYGQTICNTTWRKYDAKYKLALVKTNGDYELIYLSATRKGSEKISGCICEGTSYVAPEENNWSTGEVKAQLYKTATQDFYKCDWYMGNKSLNSDVYISFNNYAYFKLILSGNESMYLKLYPTVDDNIGQKTNKIEKSSGTGYAISSDGYIVTNHHVTNGASSINIRGVKGDFSKTYTAKVVIEDKNNDLSIVKIDDPSFTSLGVIPFIIANRSVDVGSSVFVLGYPLRATMGDEVKLTNGIISSKSGFQGDVTSYQITAPIQPGNSGGPLFDEKGNIIGIINAKHVGAENASYAIKASYLMNLIDLMITPPKLQTISKVSGKTLTEQVKILKNFTYIIEIN